MALNTILTRRKKQQKYASNEPLSQVHLDQLPTHAASKEDSQEFSWLVSQLDDCDKAIVMLLAEGYANKEIAVILNLTATNVSTRLNRLKNKLKTRYIHEHR